MKVRITEKKTIKTVPITLIHGEPGIGKSTFAANAPDVVFVCVEQGTNNIQTRRARIEDSGSPEGERDPKTYDEVLFVLDSLVAGLQASEKKPFSFVVIDTVDALEVLIHAHICKISGKRSIADFGFQKGYDLAVDGFRSVMQRLERMKSLGVGVILIAHTKTESFSNPEGQDYNYYEIKVHKKVAGALVEWSDNVLFARREQYALEENGKVRGVGSGARFISTNKQPAYTAKNRFDLPDKLPLSWHEYQQAMDAHKPADPAELIINANALIKLMDKETQIQALASLNKIHKEDSRMLAQFVDYCRSKVVIATGEEKTQ